MSSSKSSSSSATTPVGLLAFGTLGRPFGLAGEVLLRPFNSASRWPAEARRAWLECDGHLEEHTVLGVRPAPGGEAIRFAGVADRTRAQSLSLAVVHVERSLLQLAPSEFFVADLVGLAAFDREGRALGTIVSTYWNGAQDVMVIEGDARQPELLVPVVPELVGGVDLAARRVELTMAESSEEETP